MHDANAKASFTVIGCFDLFRDTEENALIQTGFKLMKEIIFRAKQI